MPLCGCCGVFLSPASCSKSHMVIVDILPVCPSELNQVSCIFLSIILSWICCVLNCIHPGLWRWPFNRVSSSNHILLPIATLHLVSPSTSGSGCCPFEDLPFAFWSCLILQSAQCALLHSTCAHEGSSAGFLFFLNPGPPVHLCGSFCCSESWLVLLDVP